MLTVAQEMQAGKQTTMQLDKLLAQAREYHKTAQWEEKRRVLEQALDACDSPGLVQAGEYQQSILSELGGILRRLGRYREGITKLHEAIEVNPDARPVIVAGILGEIGVMYRHLGKFRTAQMYFLEQLARVQNDASIEAEAEICRAIGNDGMCVYNRFQSNEQNDVELLRLANELLSERIERARKLRNRVRREKGPAHLFNRSVTWQKIGLDRLSLCHIAAGDPFQAVQVVKEAQRLISIHWQGRPADPTVDGFSLFYIGNALLANGQKSEALQAWTPEPGRCSPAISLCKEPTAEHAVYLRRLANAGVDFDTYDEQGSSALEYAVSSNNPHAQEMIQILDGALQETLRRRFAGTDGLSDDELSAKVVTEIEMRQDQAELRRCYRGILQDEVRPALRKDHSHCVASIRRIYAETLEGDLQKRSILDSFYYVPYNDFTKLGSLPMSDEASSDTQRRVATRVIEVDSQKSIDTDLFVIFFSYRWIGTDGVCPDDNGRTQYRRMLEALELFLSARRDLRPENIGIWLASLPFPQKISAECLHQHKRPIRQLIGSH